ncbi:MAG: hypothetical protein ACI959_001644, partial [Limisphaerales bacterium]
MQYSMPYFLSRLALALIIFSTLQAAGQTNEDCSFEYYFGEDYLARINPNSDIPTPSDYLGWMPGKWHVSHDQIVGYCKALAAASDRVTYTEFGRTWEDRPLAYITITSPQNQANLEEIRTAHLANCDPDQKVDIENQPVILYQGYSVHGNEASGANAALLYAWYLAAAQNEEVAKQLEQAVILLDPALNPDGINRFASWVNSHKSMTPDPNTLNIEHNEAWPRGRTNHYWFDLNRDWLPLVHPESKGRISTFYKWRPNVLTDHHEMGRNSTFFFQPGIPSRTHPLTPAQNQILTMELARYHAAALDKIGSTYYSRESFDDFYYGKGSTFPDINAGIGILFEQASSSGHTQESSNGILSFPFTIRNQLSTSLSTLEGSIANRIELLKYQHDFFIASKNKGAKDNGGFLISTDRDFTRASNFIELLRAHQVQVFNLKKDISQGGIEFNSGNAWLIPKNQPQYQFIEAIFENRTDFADSLFYDVSAFSLPLAYNLTLDKIDQIRNLVGEEITEKLKPSRVVLPKSEIGYLIDWQDHLSPKLIAALGRAGWIVKVAHLPFSIKIKEELRTVEKDFEAGTIFIRSNRQVQNSEALYSKLNEAAISGIKIHSLDLGLSTNGIDLGSPNFKAIKPPAIGIFVEDGVSGYAAGSTWHLLDAQFDLRPTLITKDIISTKNLTEFNVLIMPDGYYDFNAKQLEDVQSWVENGGTLINFGGAMNFLANKEVISVKRIEDAEKENKDNIKPYNLASRTEGSKIIGGAIFNTEFDASHPLCFGLPSQGIKGILPVFQ